MIKTISDLQLEAVYLAGLIGGAEVLTEQASDGAEEDPLTKMANNSLPAIFEDLRRRADAIADDLEKLEKQERQNA
ncbi:hypothetical protein [Roseovarius sp.]|uniref:hypothetical protein n=1 Tax=Roseovarius sp. TaxID=1486281 RepID=UPI00260B8DC6|nr:hypothetical protein [Roseovarius sp.]MDM8168569.1 hypothetical protein [Roseovarius sp.]